MKYQVWDSISYTDGEPLTPFTKLLESDDFSEIIKFVEDHTAHSKMVLYVTHSRGDILFNTSMSIYESPDGKEVYKRLPLSTKRTKIK